MILEKRNTSPQSTQDDWFATMINAIKVDQLTYKTDTMHPEKREMYANFIENNYLEAAKQGRKMTSTVIIPHMLQLYFSTLSDKIKDLKKIAFDMSDTKILVWAEIAQDDEATEDALIMTEAKINGEYSEIGFRLLTTIVEDCDELEIPQNYIIVNTEE
ncbi:hypothetical protein [Flavobacterium suncheonense]|uniref:Uncharacterized protein n=1 Tax=Flavobacterium suncheonense GH29-5 = DSM 17707 TaxID=1121899 RepID=A0A0A2MA37_9FLAO|nr:hypothetical protein [Flavobacterium suncheonense]KGO89537.1 hypothetical protein Q764_07115 [Flavobacterium suncheonense GH29-5 = DSM 17707]